MSRPRPFAPHEGATERWVDETPFEPGDEAEITEEQRTFSTASQWRLIRRRFAKNTLAVISFWFLAILYSCVLITEWIAPYDPTTKNHRFVHAPPQSIHLFHEGEFVGPFVYGYEFTRDMETLQPIYTPNPDDVQKLRFFCSGDEYDFWGAIEMDFHLVCPAEGGEFFLLGTDRLGRDMFSMIVAGARVSLTIGVVGVAVAFALGIVAGGAAGYFGGWVDALVLRLIEIFRSFPHIPLMLFISAIIPKSWDQLWTYFAITLIFGLTDWTGLARSVRSKVLSLREEDFAQAALLLGASPTRIVGRHFLPSFASHLIASLSLQIPAMILAETALSFLGLGVREPMISWGVLLDGAQNVQAITTYPWLLFPVVPVIVVVLAFNFLGDGLRDAADPYS